jgi:hypothetical protein
VARNATDCFSRLKRLSTGCQFFIKSEGKISWVTLLTIDTCILAPAPTTGATWALLGF